MMYKFDVQVAVHFHTIDNSTTQEDLMKGVLSSPFPDPEKLKARLIKDVKRHYKDLLIDVEVQVKKLGGD